MEVGLQELATYEPEPALVRLIGSIDQFKGSWELLGRLSPERLASLKRVATIYSIGSSTRIEGARLTDAEIDTLLSGARIDSFRSRDEEEVVGYADLMQMIFESASEITLTEAHILQLHGVLLRHSKKDQRHRGQYKTLPNHVEAFGADGQSLGVVFETATPFETPGLMTALVGETRAALTEDEFHPLLVIGMFVLRFLAIHPFQDGNGRLSRALTTLLLLRAGYAYVPYCSLERIIEDNQDDYYRSIRRAQRTLPSGGAGLSAWMAFFLRSLATQTEVLSAKIERERLIAPLPPLSEAILAIVRDHGRVTVRDAVAVTGANRNTVKAHLKKLVQSGKLDQRGRGRGTWYTPYSHEGARF